MCYIDMRSDLSPTGAITEAGIFRRGKCSNMLHYPIVCKRKLLQIRQLIIGIILIFLFLSFGSCTQKDLVFPNEGFCKIDIRFLWDRAQSASPEGMTLLFYPLEEGGEFWRFDIAGKNGGAVEIPEGSYTMIAINNDLPGISLTDMPYESASLTVKDEPRSLAYASPTGMVYEGRINNLKVTSKEVTYLSDEGITKASDIAVVDCYPDSISTGCHIIVDEITGMEYMKTAYAVLEGFASGVFLSSLTPMEPSVSVPFNLDANPDSASLVGFTTGFLSAPSSASYQLTLRAEYHNGGAYEKTYDVTDQVINYFYQHNVYIIIRGLTLPEEPTIKPDEVGIKVDVDGWRVVDINIDSTDY